MRGRPCLVLVAPITLMLACSGSEPSGPSTSALTIDRSPTGFSRVELRDTVGFAAAADGRVLSPSTLTWSTSKAGVLRPIAPGTFVAEATGTVPVTAVAPAGDEASTEIEVLDPVVTDIRLPPGPIRLIRTETALILATPLDRKGNPVSGASDQVSLTSSNPQVAVVDPEGLLTAAGVGEARILARLDGV